MKAILEFNLPEEQDQYDITASAGGYLAALSDFNEYLRKLRKYTELSEERTKFLEEITEEWYVCIADLDV